MDSSIPNLSLKAFVIGLLTIIIPNFLETQFSSKQKNQKERNVLILKSELTTNLRRKFKNVYVSYVPEHVALEKISKTKSRNGSLEKLFVTQLTDTVNVDIGGWAITITKVKFVKGQPKNIQANFAVGCSGDNGYVPTCQFIFDKDSNKWTMHNWEELSIEKMKQRSSATE